MDQLIAKITSLSYEIFGVFLPGFIAAIFGIAWWAGVGDLAPRWTFGTVPRLTYATAETMLKGLDVRLGIGIAIPLIVLCYFLGNTLVWVSRSGRPDKNKSSFHLLLGSLLLRIPKPETSYSMDLESLLKAVEKHFVGSHSSLSWRQFYPVVKCYLSRQLPGSLVTTYQNKYTFHRSIAMASAFLFWFGLIALLGGLLTYAVYGNEPRWALVMFLILISLWMVNGFTASYRFHWEMFGNTIITESYSLLYGPTHETATDRRSNSD
jgi:hypothetical protein